MNVLRAMARSRSRRSQRGSVQFIGGKPGGGKTLLAVRIIVEELRKSSRLIVTNVSLSIREIAGYFRDQGWEWLPLGVGMQGTLENWLRERILIITEEQLSSFYLYRRHDGQPLPLRDDGRVDYSKALPGGVLFVLDEVHIPFNSRNWQDTGPKVIYYLSQHRKLGDDVVLISQSIQNVDKQMRSMAQDFTYVRNLSKECHGIFRLPSIFVKRVFLELPTGPNVKAIQTGTFRLDVSGLAKCYDTAAGVGIVGQSGADTNAKRKGLHWAWYVGTIIVVIWVIFNYVPKLIARQFEWKGGKPASSVSAPHPANTAVASPVQAQPVAVSTDTNIVTAFAKLGKVYMFCLSNGSVIKTEQPSFPAFGYVALNGTVYALQKGL